jgi:uncharacterized membrane protein YhaH (DUF805 family)
MKSSIKKWFANWRNFRGTSTRKEYWVGLIFSFVFFFVLFLFILSAIAGDIVKLFEVDEKAVLISYLTITSTYLIYYLIQIVSATVRRLNDAGKNKWWASLVVIAVMFYFLNTLLGQVVIYPIVISIITLIFLCLLPSKNTN